MWQNHSKISAKLWETFFKLRFVAGHFPATHAWLPEGMSGSKLIHTESGLFHPFSPGKTIPFWPLPLSVEHHPPPGPTRWRANPWSPGPNRRYPKWSDIAMHFCADPGSMCPVDRSLWNLPQSDQLAKRVGSSIPRLSAEHSLAGRRHT